MYSVKRNPSYDFADESYADSYPNLHKYPATMLPQIGVQILQELDICKRRLFDPYCGSGSSFAAGLDCGIQEMVGYDLNPLAVLISRAKFTRLNLVIAQQQKNHLRSQIYEFLKDERNSATVQQLKFYNGNYWFSEHALRILSVIHHFWKMIESQSIRQLFAVAFAETLRSVSYTRNGEFKLYRIKPEHILNFNPDVLGIFFEKLNYVIETYRDYYYPKLERSTVNISDAFLQPTDESCDVVLTSPPYGDSRTTVAYGQFSRFANEWLGVSYARKIDAMLMGGRRSHEIYRTGIIAEAIADVEAVSRKRALEVSAFYRDLATSIKIVARSVRRQGYAIYIVGNRRVKNIQLPTDQFVAEQFERVGYRHLVTYERNIGNKVMPLENSPSNVKGVTSETMSSEFIVVCRRAS